MELHFDYNDCFEYLVADGVDIDAARAAAQSGKILKVKLGIDPTSPDVHLGRAVALWRLRAFQEMGHTIQLVFGDFTAQIGDTSDKESERSMLQPETVARNLQSYLDQVWLILNPDKKDQVEIHYNSEWLSKLSFAEVSRLADAFSVNQFIKRELIQKRLDAGGRISLREMLYPLMQGYDSVTLESDIELGGTDQWFNLLAGRTLQQFLQKPAQAVLVHSLVVGADGKKMSSSEGNGITLNQSPFELFTQLMQVHDKDMKPYLALFPRSARPFTEEELEERLQAGRNPRDLKKEFAAQMVELLHGSDARQECLEKWEREATQKNMPTVIPEIRLDGDEYSVIELLVQAVQIESNSAARRLVEQGAVKIADQKITDIHQRFQKNALIGAVIQVGKHSYYRVSA